MAKQTFGKPIPMLFECWECEHTFEYITGQYVVEKTDPMPLLRDTKFFCIPCAENRWGAEAVAQVLADIPAPRDDAIRTVVV